MTWTPCAAARMSKVLEPVDHIDDLLAHSGGSGSFALGEARGRIIVEAMLRGVPVLASNVGGIPEAMMGLDYLLPVRPIERYQHQVDRQMVPVPEIPSKTSSPGNGLSPSFFQFRTVRPPLASLQAGSP
jgi:hypothetical protein